MVQEVSASIRSLYEDGIKKPILETPRLLFSMMLANAAVALVVGTQGIGSLTSARNGNMLYAMVPLLFLWAPSSRIADRISRKN